MKRIKDLYEKIISLDNLRLADEKARRRKLRSYGVRVHDKNREANLLALHENAKNRSFKNSEYSTFTIYEPKERLIFRLPYYPDRILHHAIMNILEPIWVSVFTKDTYSCIKGAGFMERCGMSSEPSKTEKTPVLPQNRHPQVLPVDRSQCVEVHHSTQNQMQGYACAVRIRLSTARTVCLLATTYHNFYANLCSPISIIGSKR